MKYFTTDNGLYVNDNMVSTLQRYSKDNPSLIITDPPYNVLKGAEWDNDKTNKDYWTLISKFFLAVNALNSSNITLYMFFSQKYMFDLIEKFNEWKKTSKLSIEFKRMLIWWHANLQKPTNNMYLWSYDPIFVFTKGNPCFNGRFSEGGNTDVIKEAMPQSNFNANKKYYGTQKPVEIYERFILNSSQDGDLIVDPFAGSGTLGIACNKKNRRWLCSDVNIEAFDTTIKRFQDKLIEVKLGGTE